MVWQSTVYFLRNINFKNDNRSLLLQRCSSNFNTRTRYSCTTISSTVPSSRIHFFLLVWLPVQVPVRVILRVPVHIPVRVPVQVPARVLIRVPVRVPVQVPIQVPVWVPVWVPVLVPAIDILNCDGTVLLSRNNHQSICKAIARIFQDFTLDMYFRQFWQDPRLSFNEPGLEKLVVGAEYIKLIWVPDTFFVNEKTAYFHDATTENQFLRILHTGEILRSIRWVVPNSNWCIINLRQDGSLPTATIKQCVSVWVQLE